MNTGSTGDKPKRTGKNPSEDFMEVEERKSGIHPEVQARAKYEVGSREQQFTNNLKQVKSQIDQYNQFIIDTTKEYENRLDEMKSKVDEQSNLVSDRIVEVQALKNLKKNPSELCQTYVSEYNNFQDAMKDSLDVENESIRERRMHLEQTAEAIEQAIWSLNDEKRQLTKGTVTQRDKKLREMRTDFQKLEQFEKWLVDYKKQMNSQIDFLLKKCMNIDTRLYSTSQLVNRELEKLI